MSALEARLLALMDPLQLRDVATLDRLEPDTCRRLLRTMLLTRGAEERIAELVEAGEVRCPCHLAIGQEACAVGVAAAVDATRDVAFGAHRSHGHFLGLGGDVEQLFAEVLGRRSGCSRGMGGSMHLIAPELGLLGTVPIVGATIPLALGAALRVQRAGQAGVAVSFFGDGATEEGVFHECLNFAALHRLPLVFACENNLFSSHLRIELRQPAPFVARYAVAHHVYGVSIDGNDIGEVYRAAQDAFTRARHGEGPTFLEMVTFRWRGHVGPREDIDVGVKRGAELPRWKERDPIRRLFLAMREAGMITDDGYVRLQHEVTSVIVNALERARAAPYPDTEAVARYLYADRIHV